MAFEWKAAGLTYNRYLAVAARVVRRSLKEGPRLQAEKRGEMDLRFAKWQVSSRPELDQTRFRLTPRRTANKAKIRV
ncbi:mitochondrial ATP synthase epsilon chain domain-containing protein [Fonsecaea pedrosoi]|nr:mitochondrial ATP synthase epsilon chain domain-containing protein [Fonsecaea pedrosoi]